jgi:hypothetical protein
MKLFTKMIASIKERYRTTGQEKFDEAEAIILEFHPTGSVSDGMFEARVLLQVMPRNERNYVIECRQYFVSDHAQQLVSGAKTKIFFCRTDPSKIRWMKHAKDGV